MTDTPPPDLDEATGEPIIRDDELVDAVIVDDELDDELGDAEPLDELDDPDAATTTGQAGAELEENLEPEPLNPDPLPGFVRMRHPELDALGDIPEPAVNIHKARGWELLEPPAEAALEPTELEADPNPEAPASNPEED